MTWDLAQVLGLAVTFFFLGMGLMFGLDHYPDQMNAWMDQHLHAVYALYHAGPDCPKGYVCEPESTVTPAP